MLETCSMCFGVEHKCEKWWKILQHRSGVMYNNYFKLNNRSNIVNISHWYIEQIKEIYVRSNSAKVNELSSLHHDTKMLTNVKLTISS